MEEKLKIKKKEKYEIFGYVDNDEGMLPSNYYIGVILFDRALKEWVYDDTNKEYLYFTSEILELVLKELETVKKLKGDE